MTEHMIEDMATPSENTDTTFALFLAHFRRNERNFKEVNVLKNVTGDSLVPLKISLISTFKSTFLKLTMWCFLAEIFALACITWTIAIVRYITNPDASGWRAFFIFLVFVAFATLTVLFRNHYIF